MCSSDLNSFVAGAYKDKAIKPVCFSHDFYTVGNDFPRGQGVKGTVMGGADTIADSDAAEFNGGATSTVYSVFYLFGELTQVFVAGDYIGEGVANADNGATKIIITEATGFIKGTA